MLPFRGALTTPRAQALESGTTARPRGSRKHKQARDRIGALFAIVAEELQSSQRLLNND